MALKLYNTRTRKKEEFRPLDPTNVRMYVCGPTVYDYAHIGNARPVIVFDVLFRLLRHLYGADHVTYVRNITDVDDKINARAAEQYPDMPLNEAIRKVTEETAAQFHSDVKALGCLPPTHEPRATDYIEQMKEMIVQLYEADIAYVAEDHVLFSVAAYGRLEGVPAYGGLARRSLDEMIAGARVEIAPYKRDPMDFVLWKPSKAGEPGWPSPLGIATPGRPGWHLECSAMSKALLGDQFDIHGGGIDLVFPHHENEIAQSCAANRTSKMANIWMHNGFLQVEGEKMSKSLGNFVTIHALLAGVNRRPWPGEVIKLTMLATHYRQPMDFSEQKLTYWRHKLSEWVNRFKLYGSQEFDFANYTGAAEIYPSEPIVNALTDDLNAHEAFAYLDEVSNKAVNSHFESADELGRNLIWLGLLRNEYAPAYETHLVGGTKPIFLQKYSNEIFDARAIILNEYDMSQDYNLRMSSLAQVNDRFKTLNPEMLVDGVELVADEHAVVRLEPLRSDAEINERIIIQQIKARLAARKAKNWAEADRIRDELAAQGIALKDAKDPETGEIVTTWAIAR